MQSHRRVQRALTLVCSTAALAAVPTTANAMPATDPAPARAGLTTAASDCASVVSSEPASLTGPDRATNVARTAHERDLSSYGTPAPRNPRSAPAHGTPAPLNPRSAPAGIDWSSIGIALGGASLLIGAVIALVTRTRRRTRRVHVAA